MDVNTVLSVLQIALLVAVLVAIAIGVIRFRQARREFARLAYGTDTLREGMEKQELEYQRTPKSLSSVTSLYLPQLMNDFPEFDYGNACTRAENVLTSYLMAIDSNGASSVSEGSYQLRESLKMRIAGLRDSGFTEQFNDIKIHRTELSGYRKTAGRCLLTFQIAVQYHHALLDAEGNAVKGDLNKLEQARYNVTMGYIQDIAQIADTREHAHALNCPNCGAPVKTVGAKVCEYCGSPLVEFNIRVWTFDSVEEG